MAKQTINIGASPNDGTGTPLRTAFDYTNQNFTELYTATGPSGNNIVVPGTATITGDLTVDTNVLKVDSANNRVGIGTASPADSLEVVGSGANGIRVSRSGLPTQFATLSAGATGPTLNASSAIGELTFGIAGTAATAMTLNSTGLGVGVSPAFKIHANGVIGTTNTFGAFTALQTTGGTGYRWTLANDNNFYLQYSPDGFGSTATSRIALDSSGNVGIGVTPSAWGNYKVVEVGATSSLYNDGGVATDLSNNMYINSSFAYIRKIAAAATRYEQNAGAHAWYNAASSTAGSTITFTQAMTLDATGNLHVGTTAYVGVASNVINSLSGFNLVPNNTGNAANRNWQLAANGSAAGNLDFTVSSANNTYPNSAYRMQLTSAGALNNTTGTYGTISDLRLKENISDARNYLADLLKLRVVKYSLKEEASAVATKLGFIAQEVEQVFPSLVDQSDKEYEGAEGIRSVKTSILIPMLLKAIQELTARVQTLEAK